MLGDQRAAVEDHELAVPALHLDGLADQREGHRVAIGVDADQVVRRRRCAASARLEPEARLARASGPGARCSCGEALDRAAHGSCRGSARRRSSAIHSASCSSQIDVIDEGRGRAGSCRLKYFTPDSTLPLVWARYGRQSRGSKPQYVGEGLEGRIPDDAARRRPEAHRARAGRRDARGCGRRSTRRPARGRRGTGQRLVRAGAIEAPAAEAQRQHEDVPDDRAAAGTRTRGLAPVDLALLARAASRSARRALGQQPHGRAAAARTASPSRSCPCSALLPELLVEDLGRVSTGFIRHARRTTDKGLFVKAAPVGVSRYDQFQLFVTDQKE